MTFTDWGFHRSERFILIVEQRKTHMRLKRIQISDFRSLKNIDIDLNGKNTVFFGVNGTGKSSVLRAVNLGFTPILNKAVVNNQFQQTARFGRDDIAYGSRQTCVTLIVEIDGNEYALHRSYSNVRGEKTTNLKELTAVNDAYQKAYNSDSSHAIPVYANYGTNRLVLDIPLRIRTKHSFERFSAYDHAIQQQIDFRTFFEWFRNQEDYENAEKVSKGDLSFQDKSLTAVRNAISSMLDQCSDIHVVRKPRLAMVVTKGNVQLNVSQLSDGEKCTMALFGDLARRLALANPNAEEPLKGEGIAVIDELELHMHPTWQRRILPCLVRTFPNVQFIVTTHSPLVLSEIDEAYCLYSMQARDNVTSAVRVRDLDGFDVNTILESYMQTPHESEKRREARQNLARALQGDSLREIEKNIRILSDLSGDDDENVVRARMVKTRKLLKNEIH